MPNYQCSWCDNVRESKIDNNVVKLMCPKCGCEKTMYLTEEEVTPRPIFKVKKKKVKRKRGNLLWQSLV